MLTSSRTSLWTNPKTRIGKWSAGLTGTCVVMFILNAAVLMQFPNDIYEQNLWLQTWFLPVFVITMLLCGLAGGIAGIVAIIRHHERSWWVWGSILIGVLVLLLVVNELTQYYRFYYS